MSKEFDLNNYQYIENVVTFNDWLRDYKPQPNTFNDAAPVNGLLHEHDGAQWDHVVRQRVHNLWTLFKDEAGVLKIKNGLVVRGRLGYFLCEVQHNPHVTFVVNQIPDGLLTLKEEMN